MKNIIDCIGLTKWYVTDNRKKLTVSNDVGFDQNIYHNRCIWAVADIFQISRKNQNIS